LRSAARRARGDRAQARELRARQRSLPSSDPNDPGYRRLRYVRYADDTLLGFTGPKTEADEIRTRLATFLHDDLKLELNEDKTLITHGKPARRHFSATRSPSSTAKPARASMGASGCACHRQ
jgi:hypothetical protein